MKILLAKFSACGFVGSAGCRRKKKHRGVVVAPVLSFVMGCRAMPWGHEGRQGDY